jgi:Ala-tRNA(Pro) deacylase
VSATQDIRAVAGDLIEVSGRRVGDTQRSGEILEVLGSADRPHYLVRWEDGHESVFYPGEGSTIRHPESSTRRAKPALDVAAATGVLVELLRSEGVEFELLPHRRTMRAAAEARALGVLPQTVAKTLLARDGEGRCIRAVVPATTRLALDRLARAVGEQSVRLLTESELVTTYPQFELGAVPPFGGPAGDLVVIDVALAGCEHVVLEAGVHDTSLRLRTADLLRIADAKLDNIAVG